MAVYFIRAGADGPVKIGFARDVQRRLGELQGYHFLDLIVARAMPGTRFHEAWLHQHYAALKIRREWFHWRADMATIEVPPLGIFRPVIALWPSRTHLAKDIKTGSQNVQAWWARDSIPGRSFNSVIDAARLRGHEHVTHQLLADLAERRRADGPKQASA